MPLPECPHCANAHELDARTYGFYKGPVTCRKCKRRFYVEFGDESGPDWQGYQAGGQLLGPIRPIGNPAFLEGVDASSIPESILRSFTEASECSDYGIPRAAAVLCRMAVQEALLEKGIPDDKPEKMVNVAKSRGTISEMVHRLCLAAVFLGGKGGHPQTHWTNEIGHQEAQQALLVTHRVLLELFPEPVDDLPF